MGVPWQRHYQRLQSQGRYQSNVTPNLSAPLLFVPHFSYFLEFRLEFFPKAAVQKSTVQCKLWGFIGGNYHIKKILMKMPIAPR